MSTTVFVVSDLHLGGGDGFRMCDRRGQARLAEFFEWVASRTGGATHVVLVLAGDIVDFLAEADPDGTWRAFTSDDEMADEKLRRILEDAAPVWNGLQACVRHGARVILMLGNHDLELCFPRVRHRLLDRLGPGSVEFLYDNEAFSHGTLLVDHGNRYDSWNVVDHDALRRVRSRLSRREPVGEFAAQPGSLLVARVMNAIKKRYSWVDLLKPETSGVLPIVAVLAPRLWRKLGPALEAAARASWRRLQFESSGIPAANSFISGRSAEGDLDPTEAPFPDDDVFAWLRDHLDDDKTSFISGSDALKTDLLFRAMRKWAEKDGRTFAVEHEVSRYRRAASTLASHGYQVVVFGHTHHVKRISLVEPASATYLNTGTWANLIRVPESTLTGPEIEARVSFGKFVDDLEHNRLDELRRLVPTFARIDLRDDGDVAHADVYFFDEGGAIVRVDTEGVLQRLGTG